MTNLTNKEKTLEEMLDNALVKRGDIFDSVMEFLKADKSIVENFDRTSYKNLIAGCKNPYEKLYKVFLDSIQAAGGNNLSATAEGCEKFIAILNRVYDSTHNEKLSFNQLCERLGFSKDTYEFFQYISNGEITNLRQKKAALFLKGIYYLQSNGAENIFYDLSQSEISLPIPVDIVICEVLSLILDLPFENRLKADRDFNLINYWARKESVLGENDYYLLENLWYWGYFTTKKENSNEYRKVFFNEAKYLVNPWFFPDFNSNLISKFNEFSDLINNGVPWSLELQIKTRRILNQPEFDFFSDKYCRLKSNKGEFGKISIENALSKQYIIENETNGVIAEFKNIDELIKNRWVVD